MLLVKRLLLGGCLVSLAGCGGSQSEPIAPPAVGQKPNESDADEWRRISGDSERVRR